LRQDENFLAECFAHLLQYLLEQEPEAAVRLVASLTGELIQLKPEESRLLEVRSQVVTDRA